MDGRDWEALPEGWEASRGPLRGLGGVCRPIRRAESSREWSGGPPRGCEWSGGPSGGLGAVGRHSWKIGRDQEERKGLGVPPGGLGGLGGLLGEPGRVVSGGSPGGMAGPGGVERDGRGQEDLQEDLEGSGGPHGEPGGVGGVGSKWETLPEVQAGSVSHPGGPPGVTGAVGMDGRGCESLPKCWKGSGVPSG